MNYDRAVRLRELWNGSFNLNLLVGQESRHSYFLCGAKEDTPQNKLALLGRLANHLNLQLKIDRDRFTII